MENGALPLAFERYGKRLKADGKPAIECAGPARRRRSQPVRFSLSHLQAAARSDGQAQSEAADSGLRWIAQLPGTTAWVGVLGDNPLDQPGLIPLRIGDQDALPPYICAFPAYGGPLRFVAGAPARA